MRGVDVKITKLSFNNDRELRRERFCADTLRVLHLLPYLKLPWQNLP
jgi:hypothetical protein